ncbi:hypothetical protein M758_7G134000 [Ceratodon purpureus]|nr:hypothetical protein M758_7G134000 [Ceratodon purpureus]
MELIVKVVNRTHDRHFEVMEGVEGVFRTVTKNLDPGASLTIRCMTNLNYEYLLIDRGRARIIHLPPSKVSEFKQIIVCYKDDESQSFSFRRLRAVCTRRDSSEREELQDVDLKNQVLARREELQDVENQVLDRQSVIAIIHAQEIASQHWLKNDGTITTQITQSLAANISLELWESKEKVFRLRIESSKTQIKEQLSFVFQWIIAYVALHGALLSIVANTFVCRKIFSAYILTLILTVIIIIIVIRQLRKVAELEEDENECGLRLSAVCDWQLQLRRYGPKFSFEDAKVGDHRTPKMRTWWRHYFTRKIAFAVVSILAFTGVYLYIVHQLKCE